MASVTIKVDIYLINSELLSISKFRRDIGTFFLAIARKLLKSELRVEVV